MSDEDEFLNPVDLSVAKTPSGGSKKSTFRAILLVVLLGLWSWGVFLFFTVEDRDPLPPPSPEEFATLTPQAPTPNPRSTPIPTPTPDVTVNQLLIETDPQGVTLQRDGQFEGVSPFQLINPQVGQELRFRLNGFEPENLVLTQQHLDRGVQIHLKPLLGNVRLRIVPADSKILLDGAAVKLPADGRLNLPLRQHVLVVSSPGYQTHTERFQPAKAYERTLSIRLNPFPTATPVLAPGEEHRNETSSIKNSQGIHMFRPELPLTATLGSPRGTAGRQSNESELNVQLTREFRLSRSEISNAHFRKFRPEHQSGRWQGMDLNADTMPVVNVSWEDAIAYCNWLSEQENLPLFYVKKGDRWEVDPSPGTGYRLPTEAEWEILARSGAKTSLFSWGDTMPPPQRTLNVAGTESSKLLASVVNDYQDAYKGPAPVDQAHEGVLELLGLYGNVKEWVQDGYSIPPRSSALVVDPLNTSAGGLHVIKGASWRDAGIVDLRIARRRYARDPAVDLGFRIARYIRSEP